MTKISKGPDQTKIQIETNAKQVLSSFRFEIRRKSSQQVFLPEPKKALPLENDDKKNLELFFFAFVQLRVRGGNLVCHAHAFCLFLSELELAPKTFPLGTGSHTIASSNFASRGRICARFSGNIELPAIFLIRTVSNGKPYTGKFAGTGMQMVTAYGYIVQAEVADSFCQYLYAENLPLNFCVVHVAKIQR